ncbi:Chemotaxis histidine kinase [Phenylobacterium zucineum HLK1]|uniref:Chemotaxis protein CheA n=1 Tax=Phenylobacterium zucineum (strain HLK1) TaxID=450851 RepID=B4RBE3_PHEZH|nr:chemotaxis protein CheA [Phenylobacterium zucineum]ACG79788.1 Chemotaxis histidine kinase [Phenylobacterium zucineum HLK1]
MDPMQEIRATFFQECEEQLAELETGLLAMQDGDGGEETVNAVFRAVHSVKGGAGAFGLDDLVRFAHVFETTLDELRAGRLAAGPEIVAALLRAADVLTDLVRAARDGGEVDPAHCDAVAAELSAFTGADVGAADDDDGMGDFDFQPVQIALPAEAPAPAAAAEPSGWTVRFKPRAELYKKANDTVLLLRELARLGEVEVELDQSDLPLLPHLDPEGAYLAWTVRLRGSAARDEVMEVFEFVESDCEVTVTAGTDGEAPEPDPDGAPAPDPELDIAALISKAQEAVEAEVGAPPAPEAAEAPKDAAPETAPAEPARPAEAKGAQAKPAGPANAASPTIRVDLERVDRLIDLVGELVINQAMMAQRVSEAGLIRDTNVAVALDELEQLTREIQDSVMAIRAQPVKSVFQRMPRLVREVASATGKQVRLVMEGEGTEVDKTVIERLTDPLTHMIRNAIDHGLEKPEARAAAGKPAEGVVRLSALHRSGRIVIEVADDGAGINRARVKAIAIEKGLIAPDAQLTDEEVDNLIFMPGFSTADSVSDISGRGVGMDVVKRSIQELGGRISITSRPGEGSTFILSLPLTLAVLDGMVVSAGGQTLVVPLSAIVETLQPRRGDVHPTTGGGRVISIRGAYVPLVDVGSALRYRPQQIEADQGVALLIEGEGGARSVLLVEAIQGQRQVVIKSLEANYRRVPGIAAATILGDGRVALILDVDTLVAASRNADTTRLLQAG